ncbi:MAG: LLM class flavin-dependent oxidoreductase [Salinirussus sp.]
MQLAIGLPSFSSPSHTIPPDRFRKYVRNADGRGFAGAYLIEHLGENPNYASSLLDPLTTLTYTAGETETLPIGTSVLLLPLRNPVMLAKRAATVQHLSSRRLTLGLGAGYVESEFEAAGIPMAERGARYREGLSLLRRLFSGERVTFDGEFYSVDDFRLEPILDRPPRLLAGGDGTDTEDGRRVPRAVLERMDDADGWIAPSRPPATLASDWADYAEYLDGQGRDPDSVDRVALQYVHLEPGADDDGARRQQRRVYGNAAGPERSVESRMESWLTGSVAAILDTLADYERVGFDEVILQPLATDAGELDRQLRLIDELLLAEYP